MTRRFRKVTLYSLLIINLAIQAFPLYLSVITAFKSPQESSANFFALPHTLYLDNFVNVFKKAGLAGYFLNSILITGCAVIIITILLPMCSYAIGRNLHRGRYYKGIYLYFLMGMFVPFQVVMVPLVIYMGKLNLLNQKGLILLYISFASAQAVYLLVNYINSIPKELEEAAVIDGCSTAKTFWKIIFPLITPMLATLLVLNTLWIWNDFQMPLLILNKQPDMWTLPLFQYNFSSQYTFDYNMASASYLIAIAPVLVAYLLAQRYIVSGLTQGAVKS